MEAVKWVVAKFWEVLNGVGVDGVGVIFPFFYAFSRFSTHFFRFFFFAFLRFSSLFSSSPKGRGQTTAKFTAKKGNFTPTPSAPTPCKTSRKLQGDASSSCCGKMSGREVTE